MNLEEQKRHLGSLLVEQRELSRKVACLASRARQVEDGMIRILTPLTHPWQADFPTVRESHREIADTDISRLIDDLEDAVKKAKIIGAEIAAIEGRDSQ